ncbi:MAG: hypothetical protein KJ061_09265 [Vicinamibacteraceae bacterium]|nr:hypothetical protein [Vicinamibacteraceae bacterium]
MPFIVLIVMMALLAAPAAPAQATERVELRVDTSEAEAVLSLLGKKEAGQPVAEEDWQRLFATEPYKRLKQRETGMKRPFTDEAFRQFVLSDALAGRAGALRATLGAWASRDLQASARRVLAYLPPDARIRATVYPVIKPQTNSFVYDLRGNPAIFLYLDPEQSPAQFENTVAHELHHIGFSSVGSRANAPAAELPAPTRAAVDWMGAFGEGFAMLAAAGDPDTHPHAVSPPQARARWDREMTSFGEHLRALEAFFLDVIEGRLAGEDNVRTRAFSFFGEQGPWYTVGYRMAVVVERRYGREALIATMLDPRLLLARYNTAAAELNARGGEQMALWSPRLLERIGVQSR